ncbi:MAG: phage holin family protein [Pirellulaceae bacterium]|nr:phage holin family protein [Pirellulaceae bacterium]
MNGSAPRAEAPPRAVARSTGELLEDLLTLGELQVRLLAVDAQQGVARLAMPALCFAAGLLLAVGCIPVGLAALALWIDETTTLSLAQSLGVSLLAGVVLAAILLAGGWAAFRRRCDLFARSREEWRQNAGWVRSALKRFGKTPRMPDEARTTTNFP